MLMLRSAKCLAQQAAALDADNVEELVSSTLAACFQQTCCAIGLWRSSENFVESGRKQSKVNIDQAVRSFAQWLTLSTLNLAIAQQIRASK
eukprot:6461075-Amphidinium_carterae.1